MNNEIKIKIIIKDKGNLLANANISLPTLDYGYITVKGFQIWKSENSNSRLFGETLNITPPSIGCYGRWIKIVFFEGQKNWSDIEMEIYNKYVESRAKLESNNFDPETVDEVDKVMKVEDLFTN